MNDQDREAFVKFMGENLPCSYYDSYHCREKDAWRAACEYKQKEIDELTGQLKSCVYVYEEKVTRLLAENAKLRECVEFYADKSRSNSIFNPDYHNEEDCDFHEDTQFTHFGKRARQLLKELYKGETK